jgi:nicotinate-nucleotide adenylyltransferase
MSRIALFGGTFDPPHNAHVALARAALAARDTLALDEVRWVPTGQPWQKLQHARAVTPATHRVAMVELAIAGEPHFVLDRIEVERAGASYTLDTVRELATRRPGDEWVLLIGQDQYAGLHTWNGWRELLARVALAVARRPGVLREPAPEVSAWPHRVVPLPMLDISATDIRARVAAGRDNSALVPAEVARYIARHGLYRPAGSASQG